MALPRAMRAHSGHRDRFPAIHGALARPAKAWHDGPRPPEAEYMAAFGGSLADAGGRKGSADVA
jgi:hypothetical protein